jgi:hypothetical protein
MQSCEAAFLHLANAHKGTLDRVRTTPDFGRGHLRRGQSYQYRHPFPTSGPHSPVWTDPGVYEHPQRSVELVHALEHGNIVIYYDRPAPVDLEKLKSWAGIYTGPWSGVIVTKKAGLNRELVLTAWRKILRLKAFDAGVAAAFVDAYRGRGPEHPVR